MKPKQFSNIFQDTMMELEKLVDFKGGQYANNENRLHNFDMAASILNCPPWQACCGMWAKQLVALLDAIEQQNDTWTQERCDEVINDLLVYLILTKALFYRNRGWEPKSKQIKKTETYPCICYFDKLNYQCKAKDHGKKQ